MAYPRELLNEGEELSLDLRPHWWYFAKNFLGGLVLIVILIGLAFVPDSSSSSATTDLLDVFNKYSMILWFIGLLLWALTVASAYLKWMFTLFVVTSDRIIYRSGIIAKRGTEIPLESVNNINFNQSIFERIIGAGTLEVESAGQDGQTTFRDVRHPDAVQQEIYRCMEMNIKKTASYTATHMENLPGNAALSIPEQIEKLAQLRDQNVITEAEFLDKKQRLLDQM